MASAVTRIGLNAAKANAEALLLLVGSAFVNSADIDGFLNQIDAQVVQQLYDSLQNYQEIKKHIGANRLSHI